MNDCDAIDALVTPYVDGELPAPDHQVVARHLAACARCRIRVEAEATARNVLRAHAAVSRTMGVEPAWRPRAYRLGRPALVIPYPAVVASASVALAIVGVLILRPSTFTAVGTIGDNFCGAQHFYTSPENDARSCTLNCVEAGAGFILVAGGSVYSIANQEFPDLPAFADRPVTVRGTLNDRSITIASIDAAAN